ncbi:MAG: hypothetical protein BWX79_03138 [Alphaproteobacteria bacterium ADurb.Bin100]|jgi:hypothetical protein|nr:MAG: hypothetical protein BWX79_03138 [Alphaproteobacteria bacterium ADurb.Bin100]
MASIIRFCRSRCSARPVQPSASPVPLERGVSVLGGCWIGVCAPVRLTVAIHGRDGLRCRIQLIAASTSMLVR